MRRFLLIAFALLTLTAVSAQQVIPLSYTVEPDKAVIIPIILRGPTAECQTVPLSLETTYFPEEEVINIIVRTKYEKPLRKMSQYNYLWFPTTLGGFSINDLTLTNHFKKNYRSKVTIGEDMKGQLESSGYAGRMFLPAFECENGQIQNQRQSDLMLELVPEKVLVLKININDINRPVILKINNVIPIHTRFLYPVIFNRSYLQYISDNYSITLKVASSECFGLSKEIKRYQEWNASLKSDYEELLNYLIENKASSNNQEAVKRKLQLLSKYETARKGLKKTECRDLEREFNTFRKYYSKIGEGVVTADSLQRMIAELDALIDDISIARNTGNGKTCRACKEKAAKFNDITIDMNMYADYPEMSSSVKRFLERRQMLNDIKCPGSAGGARPSKDQPSGHCNIDTKRITDATKKINDLLNEYRLKKVKNEQQFYTVVREIDSYLKDFPDTCKNNRKYRTVIQQYQDAKRAYQNAVK